MTPTEIKHKKLLEFLLDYEVRSSWFTEWFWWLGNKYTRPTIAKHFAYKTRRKFARYTKNKEAELRFAGEKHG